MGMDVEEAAIDHDGLAGDVAAVIGGEKMDEGGHLLRLADAARGRSLLDEADLDIGVRLLAQHRRVDGAGTTQLTRMPLSASSTAAVWVRLTTAALEAE